MTNERRPAQLLAAPFFILFLLRRLAALLHLLLLLAHALLGFTLAFLRSL